MDELLSAVLDAHGGLDNWQRAGTLTPGYRWADRSGPLAAGRTSRRARPSRSTLIASTSTTRGLGVDR